MASDRLVDRARVRSGAVPGWHGRETACECVIDRAGARRFFAGTHGGYVHGEPAPRGRHGAVPAGARGLTRAGGHPSRSHRHLTA